MTMTIIPNTTQEKEKPKHKRKIIRKVNKQSEPPKIKKIIRRKVNDPKKVRKIKRVVKLTPPESLVINTENVHDTNLLTNDKNNDPLKEVTQKRVTFEEDYSEDDIECVFTVSWYHRNHSYLLDENTQEVFSKQDHSLVGLRYINEDELSVIDFDYTNL